ncbi:MAG TPA: MBL fold metallo-hydrolase [Tepidisphaeraceae bacterium]|jgi:L-ascorbate metabolism protein UlaG (beta-lactamase superfamily)|nr:MBL fold metallo-hydrolase [Tepidisphaeraceae bacterium]
MAWRLITDLVKHRPATMKIADRLGRSRMRIRPFETINPPPRTLHTPDLTNWENQSLAAIWIGHATVLLRIAGMTILTDPVFSNRVGIGLGPFTAGPRRLIAPALSIRQLPPIDLILLSHAHFDHLDRPTLHRLPRQTPIIAAHQTQDLIRDLGFKKITELRWNESTDLGPLKITARQVSHWGARTFHDTHRGFNAYLLDSAAHRVLYGGDTAYQEHFRDLASGRGVDLAILGIGAYNPYVAAHATPEQAMRMADHCRAQRILPMHHSTFRLSHEPASEPLERALAAIDPDRLVAYQPGGQWSAD